MREMKVNVMGTLILDDGMEMGYFVNVSEENAASLLAVNPEDAGSMAYKTLETYPNFTWYRNQKSTKLSLSKLRTQCC
jgi:hypothetical protein